MVFPPGPEQASPGLANDEGPEPRKQMRLLQPQMSTGQAVLL